MRSVARVRTGKARSFTRATLRARSSLRFLTRCIANTARSLLAPDLRISSFFYSLIHMTHVMKKITLVSVGMGALLSMLWPSVTFAQFETPTTQRWEYFRVLDTLCIDAFDPAHCSEVAKLTKGSTGRGGALVVFASRLLNVFLSVIGLVLLGYVIYGGYTWMTAQGDTEKVQTGKDTLVNGIIGIIIIMASLVIVKFVVGALVTATR